MENLHKLIDSFMARLFEPEARRLQKVVNELDRQNGEIRHERAYGFQWQGHRFYTEGSPTRRKSYPALDFSLRNEGNNLIKDRNQVEEDKRMVGQVMYLLTKHCHDLQSLRDALPDSLVELSDDLIGMPRQRPAGYTLTDERQQRQFKQMLDKIDFYSATRMMY